MLHNNLSVNADGHLTLAGVDTVKMAETYGTPLYLLDEDRVSATHSVSQCSFRGYSVMVG